MDGAPEVEVNLCRACLARTRARGGGTGLLQWLVAALQERGLAGRVQVQPSVCMSQCPRAKVTALVSGSGPDSQGELLLVEPAAGRERLLRAVLRQLGLPTSAQRPER